MLNHSGSVPQVPTIFKIYFLILLLISTIPTATATTTESYSWGDKIIFDDGTFEINQHGNNYRTWEGVWENKDLMEAGTTHYPYLIIDGGTQWTLTKNGEFLTLPKNTIYSYSFDPYHIGMTITATPTQLNSISTYRTVAGNDTWYIVIPDQLVNNAKVFNWDDKLPRVSNGSIVNGSLFYLNQSNFEYYKVGDENRFYYNQVARGFGQASSEIMFEFNSWYVVGEGGNGFSENVTFDNSTIRMIESNEYIVLDGRLTDDGNVDHFWNFNTGSGTTAYNQITGSTNLTMSNSNIWESSYTIFEMFDMDGNGDYHAYCGIDLLPATPHNGTIEVWFMLNAEYNSSNAVLGDIIDWNYVTITLRNGDGRVRGRVTDSAASRDSYSTQNVWLKDVIYKVTLTWGSSGNVTLFVNNVTQAPNTNYNGVVGDINNRIGVGGDRIGTENTNVDGVISDVRISNIERSAITMYPLSGDLTLYIYDSGAGNEIQKIGNNGTFADGTISVDLQINSSADNSSWTGWYTVQSNVTTGTMYDIPTGYQKQYYQVRAVLSTTNATYTPVITNIRTLIGTAEAVDAPQNIQTTPSQTWVNITWDAVSNADKYSVYELENGFPYVDTDPVINGIKDAIYDYAHEFLIFSPNPVNQSDYGTIYPVRTSLGAYLLIESVDNDDKLGDDDTIYYFDLDNNGLTVNDPAWKITNNAVKTYLWDGDSWQVTGVSNAVGASTGGGTHYPIHELFIPIAELGANWTNGSTVKVLVKREDSALSPDVMTWYPYGNINNTDTSLWQEMVLNDPESYILLDNTTNLWYNATGLTPFTIYHGAVSAWNGSVESSYTLFDAITEDLPTYTVSGTVSDTDGNPIASAIVYSCNGFVVEITTTNVSGYWAGYNFRENNYTICASKTGYYDNSIDVFVDSNLTNQNITLTAVPLSKYHKIGVMFFAIPTILSLVFQKIADVIPIIVVLVFIMLIINVIGVAIHAIRVWR